MTTTTPVARRRPTTDEPAADAPRPAGCASGSTARTATIVSIVIAVLWTMPDLRPAASPRSGRRTRSRPPAGGRSSPTRSSPWRTTRRSCSDGSSSSGQLASYFINSLVITIPSVLFPLAFARARRVRAGLDQLPGPRLALHRHLRAADRAAADGAGAAAAASSPRGVTLGGVTLMPAWDLDDEQKFVQVWFAHTCFALPFAVFLLHNFISQLPSDLMEAARVDGASHPKIFRTIVLPLITPALASFGDLPVPLGLERPAGRADLRRWRQRDRPADRTARRAGRHPGQRVAAADLRRVRLDRRTADRLPVPAALLRPRPAGRQRQGLTRAPAAAGPSGGGGRAGYRAGDTVTRIDDVARLAGVSTATVSRALRGLPTVSADDPDAGCCAAAEQLGLQRLAERVPAGRRQDRHGRGGGPPDHPLVLQHRRRGGRGDAAPGRLRPAALQPRRPGARPAAAAAHRPTCTSGSTR